MGLELHRLWCNFLRKKRLLVAIGGGSREVVNSKNTGNRETEIKLY